MGKLSENIENIELPNVAVDVDIYADIDANLIIQKINKVNIINSNTKKIAMTINNIKKATLQNDNGNVSLSINIGILDGEKCEL
jgi:hypothetical protein